MLTDAGHESVHVESGLKGLQCLSESDFDMVLLDIAMPYLNGFDVLLKIRQNYSEVDLPVVMVTGSNESEQLVRSFDLGANDYITKPIDMAVTLARVNMQLRIQGVSGCA